MRDIHGGYKNSRGSVVRSAHVFVLPCKSDFTEVRGEGFVSGKMACHVITHS